MKYIRKFNEDVNNDNYDDIKETVKDILLPITDMGYNIEFIDKLEHYSNLFKKVNNDDSEPMPKIKLDSIIIRVVKFGNTPLKMNNEIKGDFITMSDYLESEGFNSISVRYLDLHSVSGNFTQSKLDFSEFIKNDFELIQLIIIAKNE